MNKPNVFMVCDKMPLWCKCDCNGWSDLFTKEAQQKNLDIRGMYRVFANTTHRDRYLKLHNL